MSHLHELYRKAVTADDAFSAELERVFGKQASNARYDKRSESTTELQRLAQEKKAADLALHNAFLSHRGETTLAA